MISPMSQEDQNEIFQYYKPITQAPKDSVDAEFQFTIFGVISDFESHPERLEAFLEGLPDDFRVQNNGSIHEYDFILTHTFPGKRYNPKGYGKDIRWERYGEDFYNDFDRFFIPQYALDFMITYGGDQGYQWVIPYCLDAGKSAEGKPIKKDQIYPLIEREVDHAVKLWAMSRKNR